VTRVRPTLAGGWMVGPTRSSSTTHSSPTCHPPSSTRVVPTYPRRSRERVLPTRSYRTVYPALLVVIVFVVVSLKDHQQSFSSGILVPALRRPHTNLSLRPVPEQAEDAPPDWRQPHADSKCPALLDGGFVEQGTTSSAYPSSSKWGLAAQRAGHEEGMAVGCGARNGSQ
jgi:hypothetical protein